MNYTVTDALGIDATIKLIQEQLYSELIKRWSLTSSANTNIDGYGRVYKNLKNGRKLPENYKGNGEYEDVFLNDKKDAHFLFLVSDDSKTEDEYVYTNKVKAVFIMDLEKCIDGDDRMDGNAHRDAVEILRNLAVSGKYTITGYETGLEKIFSGYSILGIKYDDLQPYHCFAVLMDLNYKLTDKCS